MKRFVSIFLLITLLATLPLFAACKKQELSENTKTDPTELDKNLEINVWTLNGTTGFGMAPLMQNTKDGKAALNYKFTVDTNAVNVRDALINGTADIGAVPTNVASALYNATKGEVVLLAINTRGVLYLVANTAKVAAPTSLADLSGKTVYVPAQNPTFITKALIDKAGIAGVTLNNTDYAEPAALQQAVAAGLVDYAILPEPLLTVANASKAEGVALTTALNITTEWDKYFEAGSLVQGCVVARKEFVEKHPNEVARFLEEYKASVNFVIENPAEAAPMIVTAGIFAKAPVAEKAIPKCNLTFMSGAEMKAAMQAFLATMPAASIGGALPADDFYFGA